MSQQYFSEQYIILVTFFTDDDLKAFQEQFQNILLLMSSTLDMSHKDLGHFATRVLNLQAEIANEAGGVALREEYLEYLEQEYEDSQIAGRPFNRTLPKQHIRLSRKMDLKGRLLVQSLKNILATRLFVNVCINDYKEVYQENGPPYPINDEVADSLRVWLALETKMFADNDSKISLNGNLLSQFMTVARATLDCEDPCDNPMIL